MNRISCHANKIILIFDFLTSYLPSRISNLSGVRPKLFLSEKQQLSNQNQKQANRGGSKYFAHKKPEITKLHPLKENKINVM